MKNIMKVGAFAVAMLTAVSCSENETDLPLPDNNNGQVALGISTDLKVDAGTKAVTRSLVEGTKITYNVDNYKNNDSVPGIGVAILNKARNAWYSPEGTVTDYDTNHQVWFMGDANGGNWTAISAKGDNFAGKTENPFYLKKDVGCVYAYYPYTSGAFTSLTPSSEADMKVAANLVDNATIDAQYINNAAMVWNSSWATNSTPNKKLKIAALGEKDYMYHDSTDIGGRYVNNGHADGEEVVTPEAEPANNKDKNPGWKIALQMKHALAMVSFRVYDGGNLSTNNVNFEKFEVKNHASVFKFYKEGTMSLLDGAITTSGSTGSIIRTVQNYILKRQVADGVTENENQFVSTTKITSTSGVNGKTVSKAVSALVYPLNFSDNEIDVTVTLKDATTNAEMVFTVSLPGIEWTAGTNYIYTLMAGKNKLDVVSVAVTDWDDQEQGGEIIL